MITLWSDVKMYNMCVIEKLLISYCKRSCSSTSSFFEYIHWFKVGFLFSSLFFLSSWPSLCSSEVGFEDLYVYKSIFKRRIGFAEKIVIHQVNLLISGVSQSTIFPSFSKRLKMVWVPYTLDFIVIWSEDGKNPVNKINPAKNIVYGE